MSLKSSLRAVAPASPFNPSHLAPDNARDPQHAVFGQTSSPSLDSLPTVDIRLDQAAQTLWTFMRPGGRPSFSPPLLRDLHTVQQNIHHLAQQTDGALPFRHIVVGSRVPGIFNLGGDLSLFAEKIMQGDRNGLRRYAYHCVDVVFANADGYGHCLTTVALVQGDALGGGFEAALSCDVIIAEKHAKFGLPEILFNLFPGMGAYTLLSRRLNPRIAEKIILSGQTYTATELHEMGIVDAVAETGEGESAVCEHLARIDRRHNAHDAIQRIKRLVNPISHQELRDITDIWVDAALKLTEADLRKMMRLVSAQNRRIGTPRPESVAS
ncbi:crotonase/enoyl-CoA hydratase family protein [Gluconacetobacter asukensis]|uniref:Crotonase/enoyl-CoA hydratase family protein n=1 Tax=Gluconacetobacter asukensis TaxID=1017181 RepID=A0A7W4P0A0_9PROT|nr:crotonase/enoyl-CoA hydratase family protein [Gluconacetobacter asukensis]MBB2172722.1 crotonase/enoyl-CoA hydratase family protein [Gluconacetobacter asukensis]